MQDIKEFGFILLIIVIIIAGVQWLLIRFTHWSFALIATGFIALTISSFYVAISHATPNGGSRGPENSTYIIPFLVVFLALLFGLFIVSYLSKISVPKMVFIAPLSFIAVCYIGWYSYNYVANTIYFHQLFSNCEIQIHDETGTKSNVNEIKIHNESDFTSTIIDLNSTEFPYSSVPRNANKIEFNCYSTKTNRMFKKNFTLDYSLFQEKEDPRIGLFFWIKETCVLPLKIILKHEDKVDLYIDNRLVNQFQLIDTDSLQN